MSNNPSLGNLRSHMGRYQLPDGLVKMPVADTGAVVGIVFRFIELENRISRTKLEWQMLLLEVLNEYWGNAPLFDWTFETRNGRPNIEKFLKFMESKDLIFCQNRQYSINPRKRSIASQKYFTPYMWRAINRVSNTLFRFNASETATAVRNIIDTIKQRNNNIQQQTSKNEKTNKHDEIVANCIQAIKVREQGTTT
ncbi:MAG: hypothetical protein IJ859_05090 [Synergistaceae bacterium]|nr:hypothetical protein [Synergistaceae bacterium]